MVRLYERGYTYLVIIVWAIIIIGFWLQYYSQSNAYSATLIALAFAVPVFLVNVFLNSYVLPKAVREGRMKKFVIEFALATLLLAFLLALVIKFLGFLASGGDLQPPPVFLINNPLLQESLENIPSALAFNLSFCGLRFYYEHSLLKKEHLEAQLQLLQQQINPHFMFNVLNHIHTLMQKDVDVASSLLLKYADILRYQLYQGKGEYTPLKEDIQFMKDYIDVEKFRWGKELNVTTVWKVEDETTLFPPLLLITLIENAFKHVSRISSDNGYIDIVFEQKENTISLRVENSKSNQHRRKPKASGLGLKNMQRRLEILYNTRYNFAIEETNAVYISHLTVNTSI